MNTDIRTVLVTGPIGSGKSAVCSHLRELGFAVYDSDSRTKALYQDIPGLRNQIEKELAISFSELAVIFSDNARREKLESIVYPHVIEDFKVWKSALVRDGYQMDRLFFESALALDKPAFDDLYDEVWLVDAPYEIRLQRNPKAAARDGLQHFDRHRPDRTIVNDSGLDNLYAEIDSLIHYD